MGKIHLFSNLLTYFVLGRASVFWGGGDIPPPVPRHRDTSKYNQNHSDTNHIRNIAIIYIDV